MPIRHSYFNASENLGQYYADKCGRQAMTVEEVYADDRLCDMTVYAFNEEDAQCGLDPWRVVGLDKSTKRDDPLPYFVENESGTRSRQVPADHVVYLSKRVLARVGIAIPQSRYDAIHEKMRGGARYYEAIRMVDGAPS